MRKIYLLLVMCSISMAGFSHGARQLARALQTGTQPEVAGTGYVVSYTTIQNGVLQTGKAESCSSIGRMNVPAIVNTHSNGWLAENNLSAITANSAAGIVPGTGFLLPMFSSVPDADGVAENGQSRSAAVRFFAFECFSLKKVAGFCHEIPAIIYGPLKFVAYA